MTTATQELIKRINSVDSIRSLKTWLKQNEKQLLEKNRELQDAAKMKDALIEVYEYAREFGLKASIYEKVASALNKEAI